MAVSKSDKSNTEMLGLLETGVYHLGRVVLLLKNKTHSGDEDRMKGEGGTKVISKHGFELG